MKSKEVYVLSFLVSLILSILLCSVPSGFSREYNKIAVVVGVSDYYYARDLSYSDDNALAIKKVLEGDGWDVRLLTNCVTKNKILQTIRDAVSEVSYDGKFLFFFSGHGGLSALHPGIGYICGSFTRHIIYIDNRGNPVSEEIYDSISENELEDALRSGYTNNIGVILDTCHAGTFIGMEINKTGDTIPKFAYERLFDQKSINRAMEGYAMDLAQNGWVVIAACKGTESTWESRIWQHSWLVYHLLPTFKDISLDKNSNDWISLEEAYAGLPEEDCAWVENEYCCMHPQLYDGNGYYQDFDVTTIPMAKVFLSDGTCFSYSDSLTLKGFGKPDLALIGDFDGNGKGDLLWYESWSGKANVFLSDGTCFSYSDTLTLKGFGMPDMALVGDFDGNGKDDVMWYEY